MKQPATASVDAYIAGFPPAVQTILGAVRTTIRSVVPAATEVISYQMPAFKLGKHYLIFFAGYKKHIGLYPAPIEATELKTALAPYASGKATVKFLLNQPIPFDLIRTIVEFQLKALPHQD